MLNKLKTYFRLGLFNLFLVMFYRFQLKCGLFKFTLPISKSITGNFYHGDLKSRKSINQPQYANLLLEGKMQYFSHQFFDVGSPPNWFIDPESGRSFPNNIHWSTIDDFSNIDIKLVWEASRFQWLVLASQGYVSTKNDAYINLINYWLEDWSKNNPTNQGVNWKCGQEASFRVINLMLSNYILCEFENKKLSLIQLVQEHCRRIYKTLHYAIAQDNNHATSEASALFIAGAWLSFIGLSNNESIRWLNLGRATLEERVNHLVMNDGTFSQYSTNYHRLFLDSISSAEFFRLKFKQEQFSNKLSHKVNLAIDWMWQLTDQNTGHIPNLGANDGAQLLQLSDSNFRDFRPSIQFASVLFRGFFLYDDERCNGILNWLNTGIKGSPCKKINKQSKTYRNGGFMSLVGEGCTGLFRFPKFKFRPSQADLLHLDIMNDGLTILGDGGSYSYNKQEKWLNYFSGIESHNTIQFDKSEPMPRLSRFLFSNWPKVKNFSSKSDIRFTNVSSKYIDYLGRSHERDVSLKYKVWTINDKVSGFLKYAILRWRLCKSEWVVKGNQVSGKLANIKVYFNNNEAVEIKIIKGFESLYYNKISEISVLEIKVNKPCTITTIVTLPSKINL